MSEKHWRWAKAGQRRNPAERAAAAARAGRERSARRAADEAAYRRWRAGLVCPDRITAALDMRGLHGPEVDAACLAAEPEVDQWEAGERYPQWRQLVALARLTGFAPGWFTDNTQPRIPLWQTSMWFRMTAAERRAYEKAWTPPVMRYPRAVLDARPPTPETMPILAEETRDA